MNLLSRILQKNHTYYVLAISFWVILCGVGLNSCALDEDGPQIFSEILTYRDILQQCGATTSCESDEPEAILYNNGLLQYPARLSLIYYTNLYPDSVLQLKLNSLPRKTHAAISVETDSGESETFYLKNRKEQQVDLSRFSGKIVKMTFAAFPLSSKTLADSAKLEWSKIQLAVSLENRKPAELEASPSLQPDLQIALQKLRTYDVIYLVFDAFHAKHSNVYGYPKETTPFLAQLSQEAFIFEHMFANAPYTLASTASLFTSKYPFDHGLTSMSSQLGKIFPTINELLTKSGIETCLITNHGFFSKEWGLQRGFSTIFHGPQYGKYPKHIITALKTIYAQHAETRKFIYIHCGPPHFPYTPPEQYRTFIPEVEGDGLLQPTKTVLQQIDSGNLQVDEEQLAYITSFYDANVSFADDIARQIVSYLKTQGHLSKSVLIISSDHGEAFFQHQRMLHSTTVYDEMLHVPFVLRLPKELNIPPRRIDHIASLIDVAPTLADIFTLSEQVNFSGKSLFPLVFSDFPVNDVVYASTSKGMSAIRDLYYKYLVHDGKEMLFDIRQNPKEQDNLSEKKPITTAYYRWRFRAFTPDSDGDAPGPMVEREMLPRETIESLRELGYIN